MKKGSVAAPMEETSLGRGREREREREREGGIFLREERKEAEREGERA